MYVFVGLVIKREGEGDVGTGGGVARSGASCWQQEGLCGDVRLDPGHREVHI